MIVTLFVLLGAPPDAHAEVEPDMDLYAQVIYAMQVDPLAGTATASYSYVLEVENRGALPRDLTLRLTLHDVRPASLRVVYGDLTLVRSIDLGRYVELVVQLTAPSGRNSYELSAVPSSLPFEVSQTLLVNGGPPNVTSVGEYRFLSADVDDIISWEVELENTLWGPAEESHNPPLPLTFIVSLDKKFFEVKSVTPRPNSTTTDGANYWTFFLDGTATIEMEVKVLKLSEWGVATIAPFLISYSSDQLPGVLQRMEARFESLNSTATFFESIWKASNDTASTLAELSDYLGAIGAGVGATGNATLTIGQSLVTVSSSLKAVMVTLSNYSRLVREFAKLATEQNINRTLTNLKSNTSAVSAVLEAVKSSLEQEQRMLLDLNATLNGLLQDTNDTEQRAAIELGIEMVNTMYENNEKTLADIDLALRNLELMSKSLASVDVQLVAEQVAAFANSYDSFLSQVSVLSSALEATGNALILIGSGSLNQSQLLLLLSEELSSGLDEMEMQLDEMRSVVDETRASVSSLQRQITALSQEETRIELTSPEIIGPNSRLWHEVTAAGEAELLSLFPPRMGEFIKYVSFDSQMPLGIFTRELGGNWTEVADLSSLGSWELAGMTFIPIFSRLGEDGLSLGGRTPVRIVLGEGVSVQVYNGSMTSNLFEQTSGSVFQPDVARKVALVPDDGQPPEPPATPRYVGIEVLMIGLVLAFVSYAVLTRRAEREMRDQRRKRLEEIGLPQGDRNGATSNP